MNVNEARQELLLSLKKMDARNEIKIAEKEMLNNDECVELISLFHNAQEDYNFALKVFGETNELTIRKQKQLYEAKLKLDSHPLVLKYNNLLKEINEPLRYIELTLMSLFKRKSICSE